MRGGGLGNFLSGVMGKKELTVHQKANDLAYGKLKSFSEYGPFDFKFGGALGNEKPELVAFAGYMINGFYGLINIQTENDVIALRRLFIKFKKGGANLFAKLPGMDKTPLQQEWIAAGSPEPIFGDIMKNAKGILENASNKGLLRTAFNQPVGGPEDTPEAKNAVMRLNEADQARSTASISAADFSAAIGAITYDATPYTKSPEKQSLLPSFLRSKGGRRNRKNKKTYKNKNKNKRKNNTRKYT
jgi:hypothetical protein